MSAKPRFLASCVCGATTLEAVGVPILSAVCYCESCHSAAGQLEQAPGAPSVLNASGGVDYCLFRKDRVTVVGGAEHLREHRLTEDSATRRLVAACCEAPMLLDFTGGHWLTLYRDRMAGAAPPPEFGVMAKDRPPGAAGSDGLPVYSTYPARFMIQLMAAWAAMGFRRPRLTW